MKKQIIAITGTPGTGKTAVSEILAKHMNANLISISDITKKMKAPVDKKRKTKIISIEKLQRIVKKKLKPGINIIDGHLSHFLNTGIIVVLRCNPVNLAKRLEKKKWNHNKIRENIEAELIGVISSEAAAKKHFIEIDTTKKSPDAIAKEILKFLDKPLHKTKQINWLKPGIILKLKKTLY